MVRPFVQVLKIVTIGAVALLVVVGGQRYFTYYVEGHADADTGRPVVIQISDADDAGTIADKLADAELLRWKPYFMLRMRLSGDELLPGTYTLRKGMSVPGIVDEITIGVDEPDAPAPSELAITAIEGWRFEQFAEAAAGVGSQGGAEAFIAAVESAPANQWEFLQSLPPGSSLEGYLFPDTYTFGSNAEAEDLVYLMLRNFDERFTPEMRRRAQEMGLTIHEVVTLASIVEREAVIAEERPIIAAVYLNRLVQGMPLQADPTVQYVVAQPGDWWPQPLDTADLETDSPYNTYLYPELPPGPIANPGLASIQAVLTPEGVDYLYFVAKQDGSNTHAFAVTYEEQLQNQCTFLSACGDGTTALPPDRA
ncbi:MAG: endolytic transglycosylase MltG [Chloroflexia bacterium]|nr:endolytic transglycosylase MltG [Chloroflexia bacterium]